MRQKLRTARGPARITTNTIRLGLCVPAVLGILLTADYAVQGAGSQRGEESPPGVRDDGWVTEETALVFLAEFNHALVEGELERLAGLFARDVERRSPAGSQSGREAVRAHYERMLRDFSGLRFRPRRIVADGYAAVCECRAVAVHVPSGNRVELPLTVTLVFDAQGRVMRFHEHYDTAAFRRQLQ